MIKEHKQHERLQEVKSRISVVIPLRADLEIWDDVERLLREPSELILMVNQPTWEVEERVQGLDVHREDDFLSLGALRNKGVVISRGDWILHLDSDCRISKDFLDQMALAVLNNPGADIVRPRFHRNPGTERFTQLIARRFEEVIRRRNGEFFNPGLMIRKTFHQEHLYSPRIRYGNDRYLMAHIERSGGAEVVYSEAVIIHKADPAPNYLRKAFSYGVDKAKIERMFGVNFIERRMRKLEEGERLLRPLLMDRESLLQDGLDLAKVIKPTTFEVFREYLSLISSLGFAYSAGEDIGYLYDKIPSHWLPSESYLRS